jgi:hypothetical protein
MGVPEVSLRQNKPHAYAGTDFFFAGFPTRLVKNSAWRQHEPPVQTTRTIADLGE